MRRGVALAGSIDRLAADARRVEAAGFGSAWVSETTRSPTVQAAVVVGATERIDVGTNVTLAFPRSPTVTAMEAWDLNVLSGDRFVLGLGSQVRRVVEDRFSAAFDRPAARMAEYLQALDAVWRMERGEPTTFEGEIYRVVRPGLGGPGQDVGRSLPTVLVAAVGPLMTRAACRHADGLLGHPFTSSAYLQQRVLPRVHEALAEAARPRSAFTLCQGVLVCISDDPEVARREARLQIAFYGSTPNYQAVFAESGDADVADRVRSLWRRRRWDPAVAADAAALRAALPDDVVDRYAVAGSPDEVAQRLGAIERHVDQVILGGAWYGVDPARAEENLDAILETCSEKGRSSHA